jgi:hypothetical protein
MAGDFIYSWTTFVHYRYNSSYIAVLLLAEDSEFESQELSLLHSVQTGSGADATCLELFPGWDVNLATPR